MVVSTARRVRAGLAELIRFVNDPATPTSDLKAVLAECKTFGGQLAVLQADTAAGVAVRERHGDSGVGVLAQSAGLSRREAAGQVETAGRLQSMPAVRDAVESGQIPIANAKTLARASAKTSASQVEGDAELLEKAAELSPEQFVREAGRWVVKRQDDGGEGEYRRQRARRRLSIWDGDDGMVHLRGELDPVAGAKVRKRFLQEAERLRRLDLHSPGGEKRSLNQRMADALDTLTSHGSIYSKAENARPNRRSRTGTDDGDRLGRSGNGGEAGKSGNDDETVKSGNDGETVKSGNGGEAGKSGNGGGQTGNSPGSGVPRDVGGGGGSQASDGIGRGKCGCGGRPSADIAIVQHLSADGTEAFAEIGGGGVIPPSVLEEQFCNARIKGVVFSSEGLPLWHGHAKRLATEAQMSALRARYGACGGCGADMWVCQGHHIKPVSEGGPTNIDNMMLLCWACHQNVHHHGWRVVPDGRGLHTIAPPERIRYGPAHAADARRPRPPSGSVADRGAAPTPSTGARPSGSVAPGAGSVARLAPDGVNLAGRPSAEAQQPEPLFTLA